jgi:hypothetical protein
MKMQMKNKNKNIVEDVNIREHLKYLGHVIKLNPDDLLHRMDEIIAAFKYWSIRQDENNQVST